MNKTLLLLLALLPPGSGQASPDTDTRKPNILFAIMDDVTYLHLGAYGCSWVKTPHFDQIAKNGLLFRNAYTPNAKCAPSRSVILTGRNSWQLEEAANHWPYFPEKFKVFTEVLAENGYEVGYTGKGWAPGIAKNADGSKRDLLIKAWNDSRTTPPTKGISAIDYAGNFDKFLAERHDEPFFFWYGGLEPHRGYEYASGIRKENKSLGQLSDENIFGFWPSSDSVKTDLLDYAVEIEYFDQQLGKMIDALERSGELENTIIVVTSDNGMPFPRVKGQAYEYSNHLPLAIMWPGGIKYPGRTIDDFISFTDFAPTFLELAGIPAKQSGMQEITGNSIRYIFDSPEEGLIDPHRNFVLVGKERHDVGRPEDQGYPIRGIVRDSMLFLRNFKPERWPAGNPETGYLNTDGGATKSFLLKYAYSGQADHQYWTWNFGKRPPEELYNIKNDPDCLKNLADEESLQPLKNELNSLLTDRLKQEQDPRILGDGDIFDQYEYANPKTVHFYERYLNNDTTLSWGWVNDSDFQPLTLNLDAASPTVQHSVTQSPAMQRRAAQSPATQELQTENVFLITLDGLRWQELFSGADPLLIASEDFVEDSITLKRLFWRASPETRREALMPFFWNVIARQGQLYGNRPGGSSVNVTNAHWFSYPGYNEILTGHADKRISSNDKIPNPNQTVLDFVSAQPEFKGKVAAFGSWDVFPYILNAKRANYPINAGYDTVGSDPPSGRLTERERLLNRLLHEIPPKWSSVRFDAFTHHYALEHLKKHHPRVLYVAYGETDDFAHGGAYDSYLLSAHKTDRFIKELWEFAQSHPRYKGKTTFIITTDHGRGTMPPGAWRDHGASVEGADEIWIAVIGPDTPPARSGAVKGTYYQNQIAETVAAFLGLDFKTPYKTGPVLKQAFESVQ